MKKSLIILLSIITSNASASFITLDAVNSGWYNTDFTNNGTTSNMLAGDEFGINFRNWIGFDLSTITDTILTASLTIQNDVQNDTGISFTWSEISATYSSLGSSTASAFDNFNIYNDLADGTVYASGTANGGGNDIYGLAAALTSLNSAAGGFWAMGGSTSGDLDQSYGFTSGVASGDLIQLTLEIPDPVVVPAPAAVWLFGSGLLSLMGLARRKRVVW